MVLEKLSDSLKNTLSKIAKSMFVDEKLIDELVKDIQRALLQSDVNVQLVFQLSKQIKERALNEKPPAGMTQKEYLIKIVYDELVNFLGGEGHKIESNKKPYKIMLVGLFGSGKCVHKDSKIQLNDGNIISAYDLYHKYKTKEIAIEDGSIIDIRKDNLFVPSFNPNTLKIENKKATTLWKLNGKELFEVYLDNGNDFSVKVTPEHPFFTLKNGIVQQVRADQLTEDEVVAVPFNTKIDGKPQYLFDELKELDLDVKNYKLNIPKGNIKNKIIPLLKHKRNYCQLTADLKNGITPICLISNYNQSFIQIRKRGTQKVISFPTLITEELAEFLGYVIGDGHLGKNYVEITNEDQEIINKVILLANKLFNMKVGIKRDKRSKSQNLCTLVLSSKTLVYILNVLFKIPIGKKGKKLRVPQQISKSENIAIKHFIKAYFDCDAYAGNNIRSIELSSESHSMVTDISYLLKRFGIISSISKKYINNISYWRLTIKARYAELYAARIDFSVKHKKERTENYNLIGVIQGCGNQDIISLGSSLKKLRQKLGFTIGEIQEYVSSYGLYEAKGEISRESLAGVIALYHLKKKGNLTLMLEHLNGSKESNLTNPFINGFIPILKKEGLVNETNNQLILTEKALSQLQTKSIENQLFNSFKNIISSDVCWLRVNKIISAGKEDYVYDLTVEDNHSFIADNIIVHNTTTAGKLAKFFQKRSHSVAMIQTDTWRPAALTQLQTLGKQINVPVFGIQKEKDPIKIYKTYEKELEKFDIIIIDTAGRDALSEELITEIKAINKIVNPDESLLVISADIGQAAQKQAEAFHESCNITGVIATKMEGTAKAGGALSACAVTKAPIKFIGIGEKIDDLEPFNPKGFVSRMLGMGDLEALLEKAKESMSEEKAEDMSKKLLKGEFNFLDLYEQMETMNKMGPLTKVIDMIPGMGNMNIPKEMLQGQENKLKKWRFILQSMTKKELEDPELLDSGRIERIAKGSGSTVQEVRELLKQYRQSKKVIKMFKGKDPEKMMSKFKGAISKK